MFLAETVETGDILRAPCMFCDESLGKIYAKDVELFRDWSVREFCSLKTLTTLKQVNNPF